MLELYEDGKKQTSCEMYLMKTQLGNPPLCLLSLMTIQSYSPNVWLRSRFVAYSAYFRPNEPSTSTSYDRQTRLMFTHACSCEEMHAEPRHRARPADSRN